MSDLSLRPDLSPFMKLAPGSPAARPIAQETLRIWERSSRNSSFICNQAASFSHCLTKVDDSMVTQHRIIQGDIVKGKSATKTQEAVEKLAYLMTFNQCHTGQLIKRP